MKASKTCTAIYPGSFDPVTFGHIDIIKTASKMFAKIFVAIASNTNKEPLFEAQVRLKFLQSAVRSLPNVEVELFGGLIVDYARKKSAQAMIRGIRAVSDFDYEFQMALANRKLEPEINTVFIMPSEEHFYLSSKLIKEIAQFGGDVSRFVPPNVARGLREIITK
ncbi:MAG: pantetheine-phosphate adenylyltransferase [Candidatus Omnitrophica bacterium]|nr:pantetheine-phosphate adenylyltransferase [Candidatus Omnitrophota bacterium]